MFDFFLAFSEWPSFLFSVSLGPADRHTCYAKPDEIGKSRVQSQEHSDDFHSSAIEAVGDSHTHLLLFVRW